MPLTKLEEYSLQVRRTKMHMRMITHRTKVRGGQCSMGYPWPPPINSVNRVAMPNSLIYERNNKRKVKMHFIPCILANVHFTLYILKTHIPTLCLLSNVHFDLSIKFPVHSLY